MKRLAPFMGLMLLCLLAPWNAARADGTWANCVTKFQEPSTPYGYYQFIGGATTHLGRDVAIGEPFGPWLTSLAPAAWVCTGVPGQLNLDFQMGVQAYGPYVREAMIQHEGMSFGSYLTNNARVNYIGRWRFSINGQMSDWIALTETAGIYKTPPLISMRRSDTSPFDVTIETQIKLVRRSDLLIPSGSALIVFDPFYLRHYQTRAAMTSLGGNYRITQVPANAVFVLTGGTCTTPDVNVELPPATVSAFKGVGSSTSLKPFELRVENCPPGMRSIGYSFAPTTKVVDAVNGVVAVAANSTATGVGVQFLHPGNTPLQFGPLYSLDAYNTAVGGTYVVPMSAGLFQTDARVTPGTVNSAITFTMTYR